MAPIALLSVSNKEGIIQLAKTLINTHGFQIISSGGTAKVLQEEGLKVTKVSNYTGSPEILGGRVKTLHPRIHGGILAKREDLSHNNDLKKENIQHIDLVVVNLYPFAETISDPNVSWSTAIENIDIGGPAMIRAAAKNHQDVIILTNPKQYQVFLDALKANEISQELRRNLALEAFEHTSKYDHVISTWIRSQTNQAKKSWIQEIPLKQTLRYGENPHQNAAWYSSPSEGWGCATQLQGKELSTNNLLDLEAALCTIREFGYEKSKSQENLQKAAVVIKHTNPCGVAIGDSISTAFEKALNADRTSAFGGIVALNCEVDANSANLIKDLFLECIVAPSFNSEATEILAKKKNLRLLELKPEAINKGTKSNVRSILGGILVQEQDDQPVDSDKWEITTKLSPTLDEEKDLIFSWKVVKHVRSNAIVISFNGQSIGIGAGQMNRIGSARIALEAAKEKAKGAVLASDGFFPFDDTVKMAHAYGIKAIIQPGGSIRDQESISACNELGMKMIFTNQRHFLH